MEYFIGKLRPKRSNTPYPGHTMPDNDEFISMWNLFASLPEFANFTVPNPDGTSHTFQGYIGDMSVTMLSYWDMGQGCQSRWKSFKVSVIER